MGKETKHGKGECLVASDDFINQVIVTSSIFSNHKTFIKLEKFCITLMKLNHKSDAKLFTFYKGFTIWKHGTGNTDLVDLVVTGRQTFTFTSFGTFSH